jgi:hypothetical protein
MNIRDPFSRDPTGSASGSRGASYSFRKTMFLYAAAVW